MQISKIIKFEAYGPKYIDLCCNVETEDNSVGYITCMYDPHGIIIDDHYYTFSDYNKAERKYNELKDVLK